MNRADALAKVHSLTRMEKLIAWAIAHDFSYEELATITQTSYRNIKLHGYNIRQKLAVDHNAGIALVLILAEGVREPELLRYPGWAVAAIPPEEQEEPITTHGEHT